MKNMRGADMDIKKGQNYEHVKTGKKVIVLNNPSSFGYVELLHPSGRKTRKQRHYFEYDYKLCQE
jgi:hypothetical protein